VRRPDALGLGLPAPSQVASGPHRRTVAAAATLVIGTVLLAATLRVPRGSSVFTLLGFALAAVWIVGALVSGPIPLRPVAQSMVRVTLSAGALGAAAFVAFLSASVVGHHLPVISGALDTVLAKADAAPVALVLGIALINAVAEELFFRGALHAAFERHRPVPLTTACYVIVTATTGNLALVVAAAVMGSLFSVERRSTGSVLASVVTHCTWTALVVLALPR
jgi:membrane protease YdiL (CAAX protease family)